MIAKRDKEKREERRKNLDRLAQTGQAGGLIIGGVTGVPYLMNKYLKHKGDTKTLHHNKKLGPAALAGLGIAGVSSYAHHKLKKKLNKEEQEDGSKEK